MVYVFISSHHSCNSKCSKFMIAILQQHNFPNVNRLSPWTKIKINKLVRRRKFSIIRIISQSIYVISITMNRIMPTFTPMSNKYIITFPYSIWTTIPLIVKGCFPFKNRVLEFYLFYTKFCCNLVWYYWWNKRITPKWRLFLYILILNTF